MAEIHFLRPKIKTQLGTGTNVAAAGARERHQRLVAGVLAPVAVGKV